MRAKRIIAKRVSEVNSFLKDSFLKISFFVKRLIIIFRPEGTHKYFILGQILFLWFLNIFAATHIILTVLITVFGWHLLQHCVVFIINVLFGTTDSITTSPAAFSFFSCFPGGLHSIGFLSIILFKNLNKSTNFINYNTTTTSTK